MAPDDDLERVSEETTPTLRSPPRRFVARAKMRIRQGTPGRKVAAELQQQGLEANAAELLVRRSLSSLRTTALVLMLIGAVMMVIGIVVTVASYSSATSRPGANMYFVFYGPVVVGFITAILGLVRMLRCRW